MPPRFEARRKTRMSSMPEAMSTTRRQLELGARKQDIIQGADCSAKTIEKPVEGQEYPVLGLQRTQPSVSNTGPDTTIQEGKALASKWGVDRYAEAQRRLKDNDLARQVPMYGSEWQCGYLQRTKVTLGPLNVIFDRNEYQSVKDALYKFQKLILENLAFINSTYRGEKVKAAEAKIASVKIRGNVIKSCIVNRSRKGIVIMS
ncbi:hypothetical protein BKA65DRAFT_483604 [Rhexocercosporidium sp. MPI-PUGE-AT-0058]|nr:hypothetical protein BKA65DRAFT_483604 [Rhexocercosporidium sp. MPI-PUGE-AT-0058]